MPTISTRLRELGAVPRSPRAQQVLTTAVRWTPTSRGLEILYGLLLGDGSISKNDSDGRHRNPRLSIGQSVDREGWLFQVKDQLAQEGLNCTVTEPFLPKMTAVKGKILQPGMARQLYSQNCQDLEPIRLHWYVPHLEPTPRKKNLKIVPRDFTLTPLTLAHWFAGDGGSNKSTSLLNFSAQGFTTEEVNWLRQRLIIDLDIEAQVNKGPMLAITKLGECVKIDSLIRHLLPECCLYKLAHVRPISNEFYNRQALRKLTNDQVREIRAAFARGATKRDIARAYGVDDSAIRSLLAGRSYRDVE